VKVDAQALFQHLPLALAQTPPPAVVTQDDDDGSIPAQLRQWLVRLRLLDGVPFAYLVADTDLLPPESIRWFYVDRRWTDALVQGALAVGTLNSDDRTQLTATYPAVRDELDREERNLRRRTDTARLSGPGGPISGFLLRSQAVSGWPALHVRAYSAEPGFPDTGPAPDNAPAQMRLLRLERLAPAVLLCLFDGIPAVVHVEEPRGGVQFGFDLTHHPDGSSSATFQPRNVTTFHELGGAPVTVPFRSGGAGGVVDIQALQGALAGRTGSGAADGLDSAEYAVQLIRFPYRQIFGDPASTPITVVFHPTVAYHQVIQSAKYLDQKVVHRG
jgi:hypothetical protein